MWHLYIVASILAAGVVVKLVATLKDRGRHRHGGGVTARDHQLSVFLCLFVPLAALSLYLCLGRPDLNGSPAIFVEPEMLAQRQQSLLKQRPFQVLLEENPNSLSALVQLGVINANLGRYAEAVRFYKRAVVVAEETGDVLLRVYVVSLGELQVLAAGGKVGDDAIGSFTYAKELYPESAIAKYYLALAMAQRGDDEKAIAEWEELLSDRSPGYYWKEQVRNAMAEARARLSKKQGKEE